MKPNMLPTVASDLKHPIMDNEKNEAMLIRSPNRRNRPLAIAFGVVALSYFAWSTVFSGYAFHMPCQNQKDQGTTLFPPVQVLSEPALVPLEAHIMSKCPDAKDCLKMLVLPTMQRVIDKVNFTLSYIGTPTDNDGVDCMHGPEECLGNIIELCASQLYPDPKIYLGFTMCMTRDYHDIPSKSLVEDCALEHGIDFDKLNECSIADNGGLGMGLLRDSIRRTKDAGVTKSCTVRLNENIYCVRDGGEWKDCPNGAGVNDLVIAVEKLYRSSSSEAQKSPSIAH
ncbi:uncharacterized protein PAC_13384 [Phialocephala subalpina]|uniref:Gamma interferon inducible lysosomal thiol reductase (GILT) n=1 Tax=Phialocephala subalpina TaxID=576137 RepID=A0A1L7XEV6_9HELO|nr:uncharacterized protein PAC_13384 [Phialocephala subalpina]